MSRECIEPYFAELSAAPSRATGRSHHALFCARRKDNLTKGVMPCAWGLIAGHHHRNASATSADVLGNPAKLALLKGIPISCVRG